MSESQKGKFHAPEFRGMVSCGDIARSSADFLQVKLNVTLKLIYFFLEESAIIQNFTKK